MKFKLFILMILFMGIGAITYAQSQTGVTVDKKATTTQVATDQNKTADNPGHQTMTGNAQCKWVDANNDGKCDNCGHVKSECKGNTTPAPKKEGCSPSCPMHKDCMKGTAPAKDGKKDE